MIFFPLFSSGSSDPRILLSESVPQVSLRGDFQIRCMSLRPTKQLRSVSCRSLSDKNKSASYRFKKSNLVLQASNGQLRFYKSSVLRGPSKIKGDRLGGGAQKSLGPSLFELVGGAFRFQGQFFWQGHVYETVDLLFENQKPRWVLHLPMAEYLKGVLGSEMPASWPVEALKAQAVASRTYFLFKRHQVGAGGYYDVVSDHMDQVFKRRKEVAPNVEKAVKHTRGLYLRSPLTGKVFPAYFHADCGGGTSTEHSVWRHPTSENQPVHDTYCQSAKRNQWTHKLSVEEAEEKLKMLFFLPTGARLVSMAPRENSAHRAFAVDFVFNNNIVKTLSANDFRKTFGFGKVKSTHFQVKGTKEDFVLTGKGYGHGVGLCQWGAYRRAKEGHGFQQILAHYYPTSELSSLRKVGPSSVAKNEFRF